MDPELWYPLERQQDKATKARIRIAKSTCAECPVRAECLLYALATGQRFGIWGGLMTKERAVSKYCQQLRRELERDDRYADAGAASRGAAAAPR
jgi:WhiB family transcriptional regulator, redox-sensing transcriptional regulator